MTKPGEFYWVLILLTTINIPNQMMFFLLLQIIILATYMVSSGFFSVYAMAVDTLFLCFRKWYSTSPCACGFLSMFVRKDVRLLSIVPVLPPCPPPVAPSHCSHYLWLYCHQLYFVFSSVEDLESNDGSREKPYFMSKNLMKILGKSNEKKAEASKWKKLLKLLNLLWSYIYRFFPF